MSPIEGLIFFLVVCGGTYFAMWVGEQIDRARAVIAHVEQWTADERR